MATIDISGLDKAEVLAALYNAAKPLGLGRFQYDPIPMTRAEAASLIRETGDDAVRSVLNGYGPHYYFDYVKGRPLKIDLAGDLLDTHWYDRDQGEGAAEKAIETVRSQKAS